MYHHALWNLLHDKDWPAAERLLEQCSDEDRLRITTYRNDVGCTVLHLCAEEGAPASTVRAILRASPQGIINAQADSGHTPVMMAACWGRARMLVQLMKAGANMGIRHAKGYTAHDWAVLNNKPTAIAVIDALRHGLHPCPVPQSLRQDPRAAVP